MLNPVSIKARNIDECWYLCLRELLKKDEDDNYIYRNYKIDKGSFEGSIRREFDFITIQITNPSNIWSKDQLERTLSPQISPISGVTPPTTEEYIQDYFVSYLMGNEIAKDEVYTYGERLIGTEKLCQWSNYFDINKDLDNRICYLQKNQVQEVIDIYKSGNYGTNQACMAIETPSDIGTVDPPCLRLIDTRVSDNKLHFIVYFRSWDLWGGLPTNIGGLQLLKEYMVSEIGNDLEDGEIVAISKGLHLYDYSFDIAKMRIGL